MVFVAILVISFSLLLGALQAVGYAQLYFPHDSLPDERDKLELSGTEQRTSDRSDQSERELQSKQW